MQPGDLLPGGGLVVAVGVDQTLAKVLKRDVLIDYINDGKLWHPVPWAPGNRWFIDPSHVLPSTSDDNDGRSVDQALLTWRRLTRVWACDPPTPRAVTFLSDHHDDTDPVTVTHNMGYVTLQGLPTRWVRFGQGTLSAEHT
jgi:hypothetical protein